METYIKTFNDVKEGDLGGFLNIFIDSLLKKEKKPYLLNKKIEILDSLITNFNLYFNLNLFENVQEKLTFIKFVDKLIIEKEALEIELGLTDSFSIREAAEHLGKKAQSAFFHGG